MANINLYHGDCMEAMRTMPDKAYDLAIVDPPYLEDVRFLENLNATRSKDFDYTSIKNNVPGSEYFNQLIRVSKNQIIWGGNYFTIHLSSSRCWFFWYKHQKIQTYADGELAWTSFDKNTKIIDLPSYGFNHADKRIRNESTIHPTQKPVALYKWQLKNYAKPGDKILDTHGGSMSSAIACHDMGFDLDLWELDADYYKAGVERYQNHIKQVTLFKPSEIIRDKAPQLL